MFPPHIDMKPLLIIITVAWRDEYAAKTVHENDAMIVLTFVFLFHDQQVCRRYHEKISCKVPRRETNEVFP